MSKKQRSARGQDCVLNIPGVCNHNPETTVLAHVGHHGTAKRNHDEDAVFACYPCHMAIDRQSDHFKSKSKIKHINDEETELLRKDREWFIARALDRMAGYEDEGHT